MEIKFSEKALNSIGELNDEVNTPQTTNTPPQTISLKDVKKSKSKKTLIITLSILLVLLAIGGIFGFYYLNNNTNSAQTNDNRNALVTTPSPEPTPTPTPEPVFFPNPITGELIPEAEYNEIKDRPFLAIMIQNNVSSRPEYGLNEADIIYESLVESSITRFMGIFWSNDVEKVQSLRSARKYYVDLLGDYTTPVYMHIGYASTGDPKTDALNAMNIYGIRRIGDIRDKETKELAYSRDANCEKVKAREHCAYTSTSRLWKIARQTGWVNDLSKFKSWSFEDREDLNITSGKDLTEFTVHFRPSGGNNGTYDANYSVRWKYDPVTKKYLRYNLNGSVYNDGNGKQVATDTIIYQKVNSYPAFDGKGRQVQEVFGKGTGYVMMQGKVFNVNWNKTNFNSKTQFTDPTTNQEFKFQRGKIWNIIAPKSYDYIDNTPKTTPTATPSSATSSPIDTD